jgi:FMN phosphatase YigB (HAD superfamily)
MVGDSLPHDIEGARRIGMRGILIQRSPLATPPPGILVINSLADLPTYL